MWKEKGRTRDRRKLTCFMYSISFVFMAPKKYFSNGQPLMASNILLSVCPRSNSCKYSTNVLKLIYVIYIWHSMNRIENGTYTTNGLSTETHKSFLITAYRGKMFKSYIYLYSTKYTEINICYLDVKNHIFYNKWYK